MLCFKICVVTLVQIWNEWRDDFGLYHLRWLVGRQGRYRRGIGRISTVLFYPLFYLSVTLEHLRRRCEKLSGFPYPIQNKMFSSIFQDSHNHYRSEYGARCSCTPECLRYCILKVIDDMKIQCYNFNLQWYSRVQRIVFCSQFNGCSIVTIFNVSCRECREFHQAITVSYRFVVSKFS